MEAAAYALRGGQYLAAGWDRCNVSSSGCRQGAWALESPDCALPVSYGSTSTQDYRVHTLPGPPCVCLNAVPGDPRAGEAPALTERAG